MDEEISKEIDKSNISDGNSIIPKEILDSIPEKERNSILQITSLMKVQKSINPFLDKVTPEHITSIIKQVDEGDVRDREERKSERKYNLIIYVIALMFISFIFIWFKSEKDILDKAITAIVSFAGGFGIGKFWKKENKE